MKEEKIREAIQKLLANPNQYTLQELGVDIKLSTIISDFLNDIRNFIPIALLDIKINSDNSIIISDKQGKDKKRKISIEIPADGKSFMAYTAKNEEKESFTNNNKYYEIEKIKFKKINASIDNNNKVKLFELNNLCSRHLENYNPYAEFNYVTAEFRQFASNGLEMRHHIYTLESKNGQLSPDFNIYWNSNNANVILNLSFGNDYFKNFSNLNAAQPLTLYSTAFVTDYDVYSRLDVDKIVRYRGIKSDGKIMKLPTEYRLVTKTPSLTATENPSFTDEKQFEIARYNFQALGGIKEYNNDYIGNNNQLLEHYDNQQNKIK